MHERTDARGIRSPAWSSLGSDSPKAPSPPICSKRRRVSADGATVRADYHVPAKDAGRWAVQWNLALTAGDAPGRYLTLPDRPSLASTGRVERLETVSLVDEWIGVRARLVWSAGATLAWGPIETISVSEAGFERIYQGLALLLTWPLEAGPNELWTAVTVSDA